MIMRPVRILVAIERGIGAELSVEFSLERRGGELRRQCALQLSRYKLSDPGGLKDARADARVQLLQRVDGHAASEPRRDDRSGRGPADEIEIVTEERLVAEPRLDQGLDGLKKLEGENPSDAAAVESKDPLWRHLRIEVLLLGERQRSPLMNLGKKFAFK